jgi:hypothetical protein
LEYGFGKKVEPIDDFVVPSLMVKIDEKGNDQEQELDCVDGDVDDDPNREACTYGYGCLSVMSGGKEVRVLQRAVCPDKGKLGSAQDGIRVEVGHGEDASEDEAGAQQSVW